MKTKEEIVYTGAFKEIFEGYIAYKISLGFNLEYREQRQLLKLNRHLNRYTTDNLKTTKQMVDDYIMTAHGLSSSTIHSYEGRIRQFALYARNLGYENIYVLPEHHIKVTTDFVPYIFSQEEMNAIFKATNVLEIKALVSMFGKSNSEISMISKNYGEFQRTRQKIFEMISRL